MFPLKITDDLELRPIAQEHAKELFTLTDLNRPSLREWLPWVDGTNSISDTALFILSAEKRFEEKTGLEAGIWFRGRLCGMIGFHGIDLQNRSAFIGYWLGASDQGRGIMTAACRALTNHAFAEMNLHRLVIRCATENRRSRAIPERLGFTFEGVARQAEWLYDHFVDLAIYSRLRTD